MNKKGQVDFIGNLLVTIPKPVLFIIFILIVSIIVSLLSPVFNSFGIFCDSGGEVVKVTETNFISNIRLLTSLPDADEIAGETINPDGWIDKCTEFVNGTERLMNFGCSTCTVIEDYVSNINSNADLCVGDAYRTSDDDLNWYHRRIKCIFEKDNCRIPQGYYYESDTGLYSCIGDCSIQKLSEKLDDKLRELGAVPYYSEEQDDSSYKGLFSFGCNDNLKVQQTIKGIPIFNLKYWMIIMLIILLLWGIIRFKK